MALPSRGVRVPEAELGNHATEITDIPHETKDGYDPLTEIFPEEEFDVWFDVPGEGDDDGPYLDPADGGFDLLTEIEPPPEDWFSEQEPVVCIPPDNDIIIFVHGHTSRLEEAMDVIPHLHREAQATGREVTVLAMDLPCNGYASMFSHTLVAPSENSQWHLTPEGAALSSSYPILDFIEDFIVEFVDELDRRFDIKDRIVAIVGGSLGGNMALRLGQRGLPWAHTMVSWSPASTWGESWAGAADLIKLAAIQVPWLSFHDFFELDSSRALYFGMVFDFPIVGQAGHWYRDDWKPCKDAYIQHAIYDRREVYNRWFRLWHWRVAYEQLIYSHYDQISLSDPTRRFELITSRTLLLAGEEDNGKNKLYDRTAEMAERMVNTSGCAYFLERTGHSIHAERPAFLARKIIEFLP